MKRALLLIVGIAVSVGCFWYSLRGTTWSELKDGFQNANYFTLPLMLGMLYVFYWLKSMRWSWLLAP
ncbi:MAG: flippase-like domain-containing protein, partial [Planctomycetaceae bacterium]|nr:flippase-like domain-containing protein [Planctomycetaceae bacterium]